ncbi:MAG: ChaN family lipoprotein [Planctomycetes bacterium]|nr:ChaN family lipoprotein [Planctomycetota bacterium]
MNASPRTFAPFAAVVLLSGVLVLRAADKDKPPKKPELIGDKHFRVYDAKGKARTLDHMLQRMRNMDVVFLGESHDDAVAHYLQARLLRLMNEQRVNRPLALSLEMFERDVQPVLDEYLAGLITEQHFLASSRPWNNYKQDYGSLVEYAREKELPVIAANAPRRYVNRVGRLGAVSLKAIPDPQRRGLPPLPYGEASSAYAAKFNALMKEHGPKKPDPNKGKEPPKPPPAPAGPPRMPPADQPVKTEPDSRRGLEAQSLWDATMAYSIAEYLMRSPGAQVIHLNGRFHTEKRLGIADHLLRYRPGTSFLVVTMLSAKSFSKFDAKEMTDLGDFVIVTDPSLPRSFKSEPPKK